MLLALAAVSAGAPVETRSPGGNVVVRVEVRGGCGFYRIEYKGRAVVTESRLGLEFEGSAGCGFQMGQRAISRRRAQWSPPYGERRTIPERYNETSIDLRHPRHPLRLTVRAYDEGAALRYTCLKDCEIAAETTEFHFPPGTMAWEEHGAEGEYARVPVEQIRPRCERPLTLEYASGIYAALTEAALTDYPRMLLSPRDGGLITALDGPASGKAGFTTPWRVFITGERPGDLLERNYLVLNLNPPPALGDTSWIKPGKAIREVTLSTRGGKQCVDFAAKHNLQYVEYDAGWYGHEYDDASDATRIAPDPKRIANIPDHGGLDLEEVIRYARERGIGILLYVNRRALERQLDEILPLYRRWGVSGVKFGFVRVGPQQWTRWLHDAVRKAAEHRLVVDIHDAYRPTGFSRTYPNLLTQEGIRGNEHMPTARHNTTLPFTRFIAGAGDYTICYYTRRIKTTHAHQLALAVVNYSPLQFLFWYDRPSAYRGEPEIEFFERAPTVWDDTRVVGGRIGEFATVARRSGEEWFLGSITDAARELRIPLGFLAPGRKYVAHLYGDSPRDSVEQPVVAISRCIADSKTTLVARLAAGGGQAVRLAPASAADAAKQPACANNMRSETPASLSGCATDARIPVGAKSNGPSSLNQRQPHSQRVPSGASPPRRTMESSSGVRVTGLAIERAVRALTAAGRPVR